MWLEKLHIGGYMGHNIVLCRTEKGDREIATRQYKLDARLRAILIMTDGKATYADLLAKLGHKEDTELGIEALIVNGFISSAAHVEESIANEFIE